MFALALDNQNLLGVVLLLAIIALILYIVGRFR
jgi:hypothetical protein